MAHHDLVSGPRISRAPSLTSAADKEEEEMEEIELDERENAHEEMEPEEEEIQ